MTIIIILIIIIIITIIIIIIIIITLIKCRLARMDKGLFYRKCGKSAGVHLIEGFRLVWCCCCVYLLFWFKMLLT